MVLKLKYCLLVNILFICVMIANKMHKLTNIKWSRCF